MIYHEAGKHLTIDQHNLIVDSRDKFASVFGK